MNKLLEVGSSANIIVRAICDFEGYSTDDIVLYFEDVNVGWSYSTNNTDSTAGITNIYSDFTRQINKIFFKDVPVDSILLKLFNQQEIKTISKTCMDRVINVNTLYLSNSNVVENSIKIVPEIAFTYYERNNSVVLSNPQSNVEYKVFYKVSHQSVELTNLNKINYLPYFSLEIQFLGNNNKSTEEIIMFVPKVRFIDQPILSSSVDNIMRCNLNCHVINMDDDDKADIMLGVLNG